MSMIKGLGLPQAANAYAVAQQRMAAAGGAEQALAPKFESFLKAELTDTATKLKASESVAMDALTGRADLQSVVEAVGAAELSLQKVTAVRDRVISAYQEILRMPI